MKKINDKDDTHKISLKLMSWIGISLFIAVSLVGTLLCIKSSKMLKETSKIRLDESLNAKINSYNAKFKLWIL